jgi:hypothetical protein
MCNTAKLLRQYLILVFILFGWVGLQAEEEEEEELEPMLETDLFQMTWSESARLMSCPATKQKLPEASFQKLP